MIRHVAHRYLHDMCTLLHPSLQTTSDRAFTDLIRKLRTRQAASLIRIRYALYHQQHNNNNHTTLLDHINTVGLGIQFLTGKIIRIKEPQFSLSFFFFTLCLLFVPHPLMYFFSLIFFSLGIFRYAWNERTGKG